MQARSEGEAYFHSLCGVGLSEHQRLLSSLRYCILVCLYPRKVVGLGFTRLVLELLQEYRDRFYFLINYFAFRPFGPLLTGNRRGKKAPLKVSVAFKLHFGICSSISLNYSVLKCQVAFYCQAE